MSSRSRHTARPDNPTAASTRRHHHRHPTGLMGAARPQTPRRSPRQAFGGNTPRSRLATVAGLNLLEIQPQLVMKKPTQGWVILKRKVVGDFGPQIDMLMRMSARPLLASWPSFHLGSSSKWRAS